MSRLEYTELSSRSEQSGISAMSTDMYGGIRIQKTTAGACRKCGYSGHLPFQCYNFLQPSEGNYADISSTSSESDYETPLTAKENKRKMKRKSKKYHHEYHKKWKRSHNSSTKREIKKKKREKYLESSPVRPSNLKTKTKTKRIYKSS
ncbi:unnamed protein product [Cercopithifilaria johnstoni]|uniref:CCHC-type domain-containing protein n=1 Tax=Cercopithifilaria johnstoni TaxID=2874296 RepID=A0A8J2PWX0_9BILA|nr:unnamed protein product [Cercopithifilaria johnstoni]